MDAGASYALLFVAGAVSAALNVIAGGGSFLTLPILIFVGLPPTVANATNRVGVLLQSLSGAWAFHRHGVLDWGSLAWAGLPATLGATLGTLLALRVGDDQFRRALAFLMVGVTLWTLLVPSSSGSTPKSRAGAGLRFFVFLLVGVYGGFVQAGVGFFILAALRLEGIDLVRGNAIKLLCVLALTVLSLAIFASQGRVEWASGLALGLGSVLGAPVGARLAVRRGERWVQGVVTAAVIAFAVKLWIG